MPTGNTARIENALYYKLDQLVISPSRRIAWPDDRIFVPVEGEIYIAPSVLWNTTERGEVTENAPSRYIGIFQTSVYGPIAVNSIPQIEVVDSIITVFDRSFVTRNSVTVRIGNFGGGNAIPWRSTAFTEEAWKIIAVSIPFWCDIFPT